MTLNVQKVGSNSRLLVAIVFVLDLHNSNFLLLTEIPLLPNNGTLTHVLSYMGYKLHYHPVNTPTPKDTLPEARLLNHLTHSEGGCWIAYKKHTIQATPVPSLCLPTYCPLATTSAVEITLRSNCQLPSSTSGGTREGISCHSPSIPFSTTTPTYPRRGPSGWLDNIHSKSYSRQVPLTFEVDKG